MVAAKAPAAQSIRLRLFDSDAAESNGVAAEIATQDAVGRGQIAVLGRTRSLLEPFQRALQSKGVKAVIAQRRDRFISPQFTWLQASLDQALRPTDERVFNVLVDAANRITGEQLDPAILMAEAEAAGLAYSEHWAKASRALGNPLSERLGEYVLMLSEARSAWRSMVRLAVPSLLEWAGQSDEGVLTDAADDKAAWDACMKEMRAERGGDLELDEVIQGLALRSKEPPRDPNAVTLMTVHGAKGLEFDAVYVVGLAESVMPSWQSVNKGDASAEMEEERRNCFVAITRTRERLTLSFATSYRGYKKKPSRFLAEMGLSESV